MAEKTRPPRAAGALIAFAVIGGAIVGAIEGQPTIGVLAGFGLSALVALLLWVRDRR